MPRMDILSTIEREEFDAPPVFTPVQQQHYFDPSLKAVRALKRLKTPTNQVHFLVGYGYFLATSRFFPYQQFRAADIRYVTQALGWLSKQLQPTRYTPNS